VVLGKSLGWERFCVHRCDVFKIINFIMVFSSHIFLFYFLPLSLVCYYSMPRRGKNVMLTGISYIFYGWSNPLFTLLMLFSTVVDYCCGLVIGGTENVGRRKAALFVSIAANLSLLGLLFLSQSQPTSHCSAFLNTQVLHLKAITICFRHWV